MSRGALVEHLAQFQWRLLQEALAEATSQHWERRALDFERARPRRGDRHAPGATTDSLRAKYDELTRVARACRARADFVRRYGIDAEAQQLIAEALAKHEREVA